MKSADNSFDKHRLTAADSRIAAATRRFSMKHGAENNYLAPQNLYAKQIRSNWKRRQIEQRLKDLL
jgi:hypothetical protein